MAPEVAHGEVDARADLFAAGILLVEALSGAAVSDHAECARRADALPAPLATIVRGAIAADRSARFVDARAMRDALRGAARALRAAGIDAGERVEVPIAAQAAPGQVTVRSRRSQVE
jgi:hypothetical protein